MRIEKKADEILIPFTNKIETQIKSYEILVKENAFLERKNIEITEQLNNNKSSENLSNEAIAEMNKNITFLRNECSSKNVIIKLLLDDKTTNTKTSNFNYIYPKRVSNPPNYNTQFDIAAQNRYDSLTQEEGKDVKETNVTNENKKTKTRKRKQEKKAKR